MAYRSDDGSAKRGAAYGPASPLSELARFGWQAELTAGLVAVVLGIIVLAWTDRTLTVVGVLFGLYLVISGVLQLVGAAGARVTGGLRALGFVSGALFILLGLLCFRSAFHSLVLLGIWIGIGWLFRGAVGTYAALDAPPFPGRGWAVFFGAVTAVAGVVLIANPVGSLTTLAVIAGIVLLVLGAIELGHAFYLRSQARASGAL
jgi:uncharacterized membrane protein HdeD (DUF308 family)